MSTADESLIALAQRAVALQPAAEAVIQGCRGAGRPGGAVIEDGRRVVAAFHRLRDELAALGPSQRPGGDDTVRAELDHLLDQHAELLSSALRLALGPDDEATRLARQALPGLGWPAARLVGLRDRVRRAAGHKGRPVEDLPTSGWF